MAEKGKGRSVGGASATAKLDEADVLNLVLDYLATKGFVEAEQTLRQSVSASGGSPKPHRSNQQSGEELASTIVWLLRSFVWSRRDSFG